MKRRAGRKIMYKEKYKDGMFVPAKKELCELIMQNQVNVHVVEALKFDNDIEQLKVVITFETHPKTT